MVEEAEAAAVDLLVVEVALVQLELPLQDLPLDLAETEWQVVLQVLQLHMQVVVEEELTLVNLKDLVELVEEEMVVGEVVVLLLLLVLKILVAVEEVQLMDQLLDLRFPEMVVKVSS